MSDVVVQIYHAVVKTIQAKLTPIIVPALLEHAALDVATSSRPAGKGRGSGEGTKTAEDVTKILSAVAKVMKSQFVEPAITKQLFEQLIRFIGASCLNHVLLRRDLCHWSRGVLIRYNLVVIENWYRDHGFDICGLQAITEATQVG